MTTTEPDHVAARPRRFNPVTGWFADRRVNTKILIAIDAVFGRFIF